MRLRPAAQYCFPVPPYRMVIDLGGGTFVVKPSKLSCLPFFRSETAMDVRQMRYFVTIVDSASFSQASRELNIAQPALSQQITRLEQDVGIPLLVRSRQGVRLTEAGATLYRHSKSILRQIDHAIVSARDAVDGVRGRVTLGLPPTTICQLGVPIIERLQRSAPGILLNVVEGLSGHLQRQAISGDLDLAIIFTENAIPGWESISLLQEDLFVVVPADDRFFPMEQTSVSLKEAATLPLILPSSSHGLRRRIDLEYERINLRVNTIAEIDSLPVLMRCLSSGMGATIKPSAAVNVHGTEHASRWRLLAIADVSLTRVNYFCRPPIDGLSPASERVGGELMRLVRDLTRDGNWTGASYIGPDLP